MASNTEGNYFIRIPTKLRMNIFPLVGFDYIWTAIVGFAVLVVVALFNEYANLVFAAGVMVWFLTIIPFPGKEERWYYLLLVIPFIELYYVFRSDSDPKQSFPYEVRQFGKMGLVYDKNERTYSMVFRVSGSRISAQNMVAQYGMVQQFGAMLVRASAVTGLKGLRVTFGYDVRPQNPWEIRNMMMDIANVEVMNPKAIADEKPYDKYTPFDDRMLFHNQLEAEMEELFPKVGSDVQMAVIVTIDDSQKFRRILKRESYYSSEIRNTPLVRIRETMLSQLGGLMDGVVLLDGFGAEQYLIRSKGIDNEAFFDALQERMENAGENSDGTLVYDKLVDYLPTKLFRRNLDSLQIDNTYVATIRITESAPNLDEVPPDFIREYTHLFDLPAEYYSISISGKTKKGSTQYFRNEAGNKIASTAVDLVGAGSEGVRAQRLAEERDESQRQLDSSVYTADWTVRIAILNLDPEVLQDEVINCIDVLRSDQLGPVHVEGRFRQVEEALPTLTHIPKR